LPEKANKRNDKNKKTPDAKPGVGAREFSVIEKDDVQLQESGRVLLDTITLLGKTNWTK
jgi:hypothetical protein